VECGGFRGFAEGTDDGLQADAVLDVDCELLVCVVRSEGNATNRTGSDSFQQLRLSKGAASRRPD
jgi:hypothetical protein